MPSDEAPRQAAQAEPIRNPEQLQQAKLPDASEPREAADERREPPRCAGVLGQLEAERAHD